jgi:hypothetical protein
MDLKGSERPTRLRYACSGALVFAKCDCMLVQCASLLYCVLFRLRPVVGVCAEEDVCDGARARCRGLSGFASESCVVVSSSIFLFVYVVVVGVVMSECQYVRMICERCACASLCLWSVDIIAWRVPCTTANILGIIFSATTAVPRCV